AAIAAAGTNNEAAITEASVAFFIFLNMFIILPVCSTIIVNSFRAIIITKYLEGFLQLYDIGTTQTNKTLYYAIFHHMLCHQVAIFL
ncbi:hypothetical protein, partial [Lysinibacillus sphaericus]|uniref:hypothetical protein n=1 Tax=Lysinibacillus sphaericus TaxID=1421 RepID=UPI00055DE7EB